jgi:DNA repair protein RadC
MTSQHESDALSAHGRLEYHTTVRDLPTHEQPRERLQHAGPQALSAAELLAIALRTGTRRDNALELAAKLLARYGGLSGLVRADFGALCSEYGMGKAKTAQLKAALEIGRRLGVLQPEEKYRIHSSADAANLVMVEMAYLDHEQLRILLLDGKNQVVGNILRYQGTVNSSVLRVAEVFRPAITNNCPAIIVCHNHPSGDPLPSEDDLHATRQLVEAGAILDIELVDHLIIGSGRFVSLKEQLKWL